MSQDDSPMASTAAAQAQALARTIEVRNANVVDSVRRFVAPHNEPIVCILQQNRSRAAAANAVFRGMCADTERGLDPTYFAEVSVEFDPPEDVTAAVRRAIADARGAREAKSRRLSKEYSDLLAIWKKKTKQARDKRSRDKREACRDRDRFLLRTIMGEEALSTARTSSGRATTKVIAGVTPGGQVGSSQQERNDQIDASLKEIELAGGTPGADATWSRTLAEIPEQRADFVPIDCGSVLIVDPVAEYVNSATVNPWSREETFVFLDKYVLYPKNFRRIASFIEHKSVGDVIRFYYENKLRLGLKQLSQKRKAAKRTHLLSLAGLRRPPDLTRHRLGTPKRTSSFVDGVQSVGSLDLDLLADVPSSPRKGVANSFLDVRREDSSDRCDVQSSPRRRHSLESSPPRLRAHLRISERREKRAESEEEKDRGKSAKSRHRDRDRDRERTRHRDKDRDKGRVRESRSDGEAEVNRDSRYVDRERKRDRERDRGPVRKRDEAHNHVSEESRPAPRGAADGTADSGDRNSNADRELVSNDRLSVDSGESEPVAVKMKPLKSFLIQSSSHGVESDERGKSDIKAEETLCVKKTQNSSNRDSLPGKETAASEETKVEPEVGDEPATPVGALASPPSRQSKGDLEAKGSKGDGRADRTGERSGRPTFEAKSEDVEASKILRDTVVVRANGTQAVVAVARRSDGDDDSGGSAGPAEELANGPNPAFDSVKPESAARKRDAEGKIGSNILPGNSGEKGCLKTGKSVTERGGEGDVPTNEDRKAKSTAMWTPKEEARFSQLHEKYGRDWIKIASYMPPKTPKQCKGYWRKISKAEDRAALGSGGGSRDGAVLPSEKLGAGTGKIGKTRNGSSKDHGRTDGKGIKVPETAKSSSLAQSPKSPKSLESPSKQPAEVLSSSGPRMRASASNSGTEVKEYAPLKRPSRLDAFRSDNVNDDREVPVAVTGFGTGVSKSAGDGRPKTGKPSAAEKPHVARRKDKDTPSKKRDAEAAELPRQQDNHVKRERSFPEGSVESKIGMNGPVGAGQVASRSPDVNSRRLSENADAVSAPNTPSFVRAVPSTRVPNAALQASWTGAPKSDNTLRSPIPRPGAPLSSPASSVPRSATPTLPKFRSAPQPHGSAKRTGAPGESLPSLPIPGSTPGSHPLAAASRVPLSAPPPRVFGHSKTSPPDTPRAGGSSKSLQEILKRARAAGFIGKNGVGGLGTGAVPNANTEVANGPRSADKATGKGDGKDGNNDSQA